MKATLYDKSERFPTDRIDLSGLVVIVGNYGSGKTEVAINLAVDQNARNRHVRLADLDLVNPYFRTREARATLTALGIEMVLPPEHLLHADLPVLSPAVAGMIRQPAGLTILDVGGDGVGATVLAAMADAFQGLEKPVSVLQVVNPFRPNTDTVSGCLGMRSAIEAASHLKITGWIGNANLIEETEAGHINDGFLFMQRLSERSGLPLAFVTAAEELAGSIDRAVVSCPVLTIHRQLVPPWRKPSVLPVKR